MKFKLLVLRPAKPAENLQLIMKNGAVYRKPFSTYYKEAVMKRLNRAVLSALMVAVAVQASEEKTSEQEPVKMRYYLMIGKPTPAVWDMIVKSGGKNMTDPGREATEALGGKVHSYFIGANEAKNYIIVAYPEDVTVADIVYMRAAQGVMEELEFIEIIPAENAHLVFDRINSKKKQDNE